MPPRASEMQEPRRKRFRGRRAGRRVQAATRAALQYQEAEQPRKYQRTVTEDTSSSSSEAPAPKRAAVERTDSKPREPPPHPSWLSQGSKGRATSTTSKATRATEPTAPPPKAAVSSMATPSSTASAKKPPEPPHPPRSKVAAPTKAAVHPAPPTAAAVKATALPKAAVGTHPKGAPPPKTSAPPKAAEGAAASQTKKERAPGRDIPDDIDSNDEEVTKALKLVYYALNPTMAKMYIEMLSKKHNLGSTAVNLQDTAKAAASNMAATKTILLQARSLTLTRILQEAMGREDWQTIEGTLQQAVREEVPIPLNILQTVRESLKKPASKSGMILPELEPTPGIDDWINYMPWETANAEAAEASPEKTESSSSYSDMDPQTEAAVMESWAEVAKRGAASPPPEPPLVPTTRIAVDLHGVLDVEDSFPARCLGQMDRLWQYGVEVTVMSFIGEENTYLRQKAQDFVNDANRRLARRYPHLQNYLKLVITDRRVGKRGKCAAMHELGMTTLIDDNKDILDEADRYGYMAIGIRTKRERHPHREHVFDHVHGAFQLVIEQAMQRHREVLRGARTPTPPSTPTSPATSPEEGKRLDKRPKRRHAVASRAPKLGMVALTQDAVKRHSKETEVERTLRLVNEGLGTAVEEMNVKRKREPYRDPEYVARQQARKEERAKFKGTVGITMAKRLPSPRSTCHRRKVKTTAAAKDFASRRIAKKWRIKRTDNPDQ